MRSRCWPRSRPTASVSSLTRRPTTMWTTSSTSPRADGAVKRDRADGKRLHAQVARSAGDAAVCEDPRQQRADDATDAMHAEDVERIVGPQHALERGCTPVAGQPGDQTDGHRGGRRHEARSRRDRHKACHQARTQAEQRRAAPCRPLADHPAQRARRRGKVRHQHRKPGSAIGRHGRSSVESEPAHPQQAGTDHRQRQAVGLERLAPVAAARADRIGTHQPRHARVHVHHRAAGEVEHPHLGEPATRLPDPVRDRRIDEDAPEQGEPEHRRQPHALHERADDERTGDDGEGQLEHRIHGLRDIRRDMAHRDGARFFQVVEAGKPEAARAAEP